MAWLSSPRDCSSKYPIISYGKDVEGHRDLVRNAFEFGISPLLNYKRPGFAKGWYAGLVRDGHVCQGTGGVSGNDCDEYPYRATDQGGPDNYKAGRVLLGAVIKGQNRSAGSKLFNRLLAPCDIKPSSIDPSHSGFAVVPLEGFPTTVGRCADGSYHAGGG